MQGVSGESTWRRSRIIVPVAQPAAGADWSVPVPAGHLWQLLGVTATLLSSAVVANRNVALALSDDRNPFLTVPALAVQAAGVSNVYSWAGEAGPVALGVRQLSPLPAVILPTAWTIGTSTLAIDVGDQWSAIRLLVLDVTARRGRLDLDSIPDFLVGVVDLGPNEPA